MATYQAMTNLFFTKEDKLVLAGSELDLSKKKADEINKQHGPDTVVLLEDVKEDTPKEETSKGEEDTPAD